MTYCDRLIFKVDSSNDMTTTLLACNQSTGVIDNSTNVDASSLVGHEIVLFDDWVHALAYFGSIRYVFNSNCAHISIM